jgi:hypothetical protein
MRKRTGEAKQVWRFMVPPVACGRAAGGSGGTRSSTWPLKAKGGRTWIGQLEINSGRREEKSDVESRDYDPGNMRRDGGEEKVSQDRHQ